MINRAVEFESDVGAAMVEDDELVAALTDFARAVQRESVRAFANYSSAVGCTVECIAPGFVKVAITGVVANERAIRGA